MKTKYKTAKTIKEYSTVLKGKPVTVPVGSTVSNRTAAGCNDQYRFWIDFKEEAVKQSGGFENSILHHDLTYYGVNVPEDHCEPWKE